MKDAVYIIHCPPSWTKTIPLSLVYLKSYLKQRDVETRTIDLNILFFELLAMTPKAWLTLDSYREKTLFSAAQEKFPGVFEHLYEAISDVSCVGFSLTRRNTPFSFSLAQNLQERFPDKKIIFGGPETFSLDQCNALDVRYSWVIGEGEMPLYTFINSPSQHVYRFQELQNLDSLSFYDFDTARIDKYSPVIPLLSSRGCPHQCAFCSEKMLYKKFRHHSARYIVEQIKLLIATYQRNHFVFCDSLINYDRDWLEEFCSLIMRDNLTITWEAQIRVDRHMPKELALLMKKSGCINLFVGLESGSDRVLKNMNKGFFVSDASIFFETLSAAKLQFEISLIFGYPTENENDFKQTIDFIISHKTIIPKIAQANPFIDYLGTFRQESFPSCEAKSRIQHFLKIIQREKIRYTKSFINNLIYETRN